jgi:asparagine synthase (glutamine-hydrolysing)
MCGIFWYLLSQDTNTTDVMNGLINKHASLINHRGPDGSRHEVWNNQLWVFHRLAVINLNEEGMQPFVSKDGNSRLICNGEIYNYKQLSEAFNASLRSDCEIIQLMLDECASTSRIIARVNALDGDFAFVYANDRYTVIARDHVGVSPLFYGTDINGKLICVASEVKALIGTPRVEKVDVFPPGHVNLNGVFHRYTAMSLTKPLALPQHEAASDVKTLVTEAIRKRLCHSDRQVGVLCSGGIDSSIVTCMLCELGLRDKVHVFTMEYEGDRSEDAFYARMLCQMLGVQQTVFTFNRDDVKKTIPLVIKSCETYDPNTVRAAVPMYLMAHKITQNTQVKVILSGEGADEVFHGYNYFRKAPNGEIARKEAKRLVENLHMFDLLRAERCFASAGMEVRVPFLDRDLVQYVQSLEGKLVWGGQGYSEKQLLRDAFSHIDSLSATRILDRPKERFSDGCGFSYVPQLLSDISEGLSTLDARLAVEKKVVKELFDETYPNNTHLIIDRSMPDWTKQESSDLLAM